MTAGTDDYDEIVRVAQLYVDGFNDNDVSKFREAFHEDAWIFYIDAEGGPHKNLISENFEEWAPPPSSGIVGRIISGDTGGRCCLGPAQLRPQGQALWMNRLPQSSAQTHSESTGRRSSLARMAFADWAQTNGFG